MTVNDEKAALQIGKAFAETFGADFDSDVMTSNASEDVSVLATSVNKPSCFWFTGSVDGEKWDKAEREDRIHDDIPVNHSGLFAPVIQPTMRIGFEALCVAALSHLASRES